MLTRRGTVRRFRPDPVPDSWARSIVELGMRAPTSSNRQEYSVVQVHDPEKRRALAKLCTNQQHIVDCPAFFAVCADQNRVAHALSLYDKEYPAYGLEAGLVASIDAALVGLTMSYVAESFGLSSVMIGAARNHPVEVAKVLELPPRCYVVFGLCVGWPERPPLPKPRHGLTGVLHQDVYRPDPHEATVHAYDGQLADYYRARGVETPEAAWTKVLSEKLASPKRTALREELRELGFPFL